MVRLTPKGGADRIDGWDVDTDGRPFLKARVKAMPVEGEANAALIALLAKHLKLSKRQVEIARGGQSRLKQVEIEGLSQADLDQRMDKPEA